MSVPRRLLRRRSFEIGMTRHLEPMGRVNELSIGPFRFVRPRPQLRRERGQALTGGAPALQRPRHRARQQPRRVLKVAQPTPATLFPNSRGELITFIDEPRAMEDRQGLAGPTERVPGSLVRDVPDEGNLGDVTWRRTLNEAWPVSRTVNRTCIIGPCLKYRIVPRTG